MSLGVINHLILRIITIIIQQIISKINSCRIKIMSRKKVHISILVARTSHSKQVLPIGSRNRKGTHSNIAVLQRLSFSKMKRNRLRKALSTCQLSCSKTYYSKIFIQGSQRSIRSSEAYRPKRKRHSSQSLTLQNWKRLPENFMMGITQIRKLRH